MNPAIPPNPERTRVTDDNLVMHWLKRADLALKTISYAQNHEDILLARALPHRDGFFIDVGANPPVFHSVTKLFTDRGWSGINIEPSPPVFDRLQHDRPDQINLNLNLNLNVGGGDVATTLTFYETPTRHGWSTFRLELAEHYRSIGVVERPVPVRILTEVYAEHVGDRPIDFLKVDAEGFEKQVRFGMDFGRWRPWVRLIDDHVRSIEELNRKLAIKPSLIDALRADAPRVARKLRAVVGRLGRRRAG